MILAFDLAPRKCGWVAGDGSKVPDAGGFRIPGVGDDLGELLDVLDSHATRLFDRYQPTRTIQEAPILPSQYGDDPATRGSVMGSLLQRRGQFCMGPHIEFMSRRRGVAYHECDIYDVKQALTGSKKAQKPDMVRMALKLGVTLPELLVEGREDAADALGVWLVGVRFYAKEFAPAWDRRVYSPLGALL